MFIPNREVKVGDTIRLNTECVSTTGTFEKGSIVNVIGIGEQGYDIEDDYGNKMCEIGWDVTLIELGLDK